MGWFKYKMDESYFDEVDSAEKAYVLGWFYSDGNVTEQGRFRIELAETDGYILKWIKKQLKYTGPLYNKPARNGSKPQVSLCINRKRVADKLIALGCSPRKAHIVEFPTEEIVPRQFLSHFLRGMFDGDGSVGWRESRKNKLQSLNYTGSKPFITALGDFLTSLGVNHKIYDRPDKDSLCLFVMHRPSMAKLIDFLYRDSEHIPCLKRKQEKCNELASRNGCHVAWPNQRP
jgi:DNA-binding transcriptional regulator WhiA